MGSALLNPTMGPEFAGGESALPAGLPRRTDPRRTPPAAPAVSVEELRIEAAERVAAHRNRRGAQPPPPAKPASAPAPGVASRSARIAATVAERYANTQSYRAFLAAEAERAIQQAQAAAEVAALNAQAVAAAQQRMLQAFDEQAGKAAQQADAPPGPLNEAAAQHGPALALDEFLLARGAAAPSQQVELNLWPEFDAQDAPEAAAARGHRTRARRSATQARDEAHTSNPNAELTVRLYEDASSAALVHVEAARAHLYAHARPERNDAEAQALDEEIAFRRAPVFEEPAGPPVPLPANLIEFPRQLIASRKARPRYAEGPLRDEDEAAPGDGQLRIFEVDPARISTQPAAYGEAAAAPQWTSIWLDTPAAPGMEGEAGAGHALPCGAHSDSDLNSEATPLVRTLPPLEPATIRRRLMAGAINGAIVLAGVLAFGATLAALSGYRLTAQPGGSHLDALLHLAARLPAETGLEPAQIASVAAAAGAFLCLLYQALFFCFSDATPGMRVVRIALCTFDDENPTRTAIRRRAAAMLLSACPFALGFLWAALDEDRLTWHDRISRMYLRSY